MRRDAGAAVAEFLVVVVLIAVPLTYTAVTVLRVHMAAVTAQTSASAAALAVVRGTVPPSGAGRVARSYWRAEPAVAVGVDCRPGGCAGATVGVTVSTEVALPGVPGDWLSVPVSATSSQAADRYGAVGR